MRIRNCYFCGSKPKTSSGVTGVKLDAKFPLGYKPFYFVLCDCGARGPFKDNLNDAVAYWNSPHMEQ